MRLKSFILGFSLTELLAVVIMIGILLSCAMFLMGSLKTDMRLQKEESAVALNEAQANVRLAQAPINQGAGTTTAEKAGSRTTASKPNWIAASDVIRLFNLDRSQIRLTGLTKPEDAFSAKAACKPGEIALFDRSAGWILVPVQLVTAGIPEEQSSLGADSRPRHVSGQTAQVVARPPARDGGWGEVKKDAPATPPIDMRKVKKTVTVLVIALAAVLALLLVRRRVFSSVKDHGIDFH